MATFLCPKGHDSAEADYCSECGARIVAVALPVEAVPIPVPLVENCPQCGAPREHSQIVFCEICGLNFATGAGSGIPVVTSPVKAKPTAPMGWQVVIAVDPSLGEPGGPEPPQIAPSTITLHEPVSLIGRKSEARAIFPEIPLQHDDAVSHRHAVVQLAQDGTLSLRDVGASNGTKLNGQQIKQMVDYPLKDGDQVTLGRWSRLTIQALP